MLDVQVLLAVVVVLVEVIEDRYVAVTHSPLIS